MDKTAKQKLGKRGEDAACDFLRRQGFVVVERNYWKPWGEIDIVARRGEELRLVEVKTVSREWVGEAGDDYEPEDNLHPWKRQRLRRVIETYLLAHPALEELEWQVDAISVYINQAGKVVKIEVLEDLAL